MSFSLDFTATQADAGTILEQEYAPECVKVFIKAALTAFAPEALVFVKAYGHLYNKDYNISNATIAVQEVSLRKPRSSA